MFSSPLLARACAPGAVLPHNWNWQRQWDFAAGFLSQHPIRLLDIGARGGPPPELATLAPHVRRVGFEPDDEECRRLNAESEGSYFPKMVAGAVGRQALHLYRDRGYSSVLEISGRYEQLWSGVIPVDDTLVLDTVTLDGFLAEHPDLRPDMLKMDTQGSELGILEGAKESLDTIGLVEVEVEFLPIYQDQPLAADVMRFMAERGFELLYLNRVFQSRRRVYTGPSRGQLIFGDALFGKREDQLSAFSDEQRAKYVVLLCQYGHLDIAWQLLRQHPELERLVPGIGSVFRRRARAPARVALMQVDKLLALALHLRRYNQRATDSDRSWPIR